MSVIFFDPQDLARIAANAVGGNLSDSNGKRQLNAFCESLADYSECNAKAYAAQYNEATKGWTADEIRACVRPSMVAYADEQKAARQDAVLLAYNAVSNDGTDYLTGEAARDLLSILGAFLRS